MTKKPKRVPYDPPMETVELRKALAAFFDQKILDSFTKEMRAVGNFEWGVYAFYDYDGEPIYVGQTRESIRTRIGRHLTNQRTDAVAMAVLDPFEVSEVEVWPLAEFQESAEGDAKAKTALMALERQVYDQILAKSKFKAVLNEKDPQRVAADITVPISIRVSVVSGRVKELRGHPDVRVARRALTISRLAQVISERKVQGGLRRTLLVQARRLAALAEQRFTELGGESLVESENIDIESDQDGGDA